MVGNVWEAGERTTVTDCYGNVDKADRLLVDELYGSKWAGLGVGV